MAQQQALLLEAKFGDLTIRTIDVPKPGTGEVLVKIQSAALNPMDWKVHKYGVFVDKVPTVFGWDIAGDVVQVGEGLESAGFAVGDRVFFQGTRTDETRGYQQYTIAKSPLIGKIPHNLTYDDASTLPVAALTAFIALFQKSPEGFGLPNTLFDDEGGRDDKLVGQTIVVLGGPSQLGQFVLQYAKLVGFSSIITTASLKHTDYLKSLGATHVIDRNASLDAFSSQVSEICSTGFKYVIDTISSPETQQFGYDLLSADGELVMVLPGQETIKNKVEGKKVHTFSAFATLPQHRELANAFFGNIPSLFAKGTLKTTPVEVLPNGLAGITDGLKRLENNQVSGVKLVARPQET